MSVRFLKRIDGKPFASAGLLAVAAVVVAVECNGSYAGIVISTGIGYAVVVVGMVLQLGYSNQLAFSQSIFMGCGAYGYSLMEVRYGLPPLLALLATLAAATLVSVVVGALITHAPGISLALATLLLPFVCYELATGWGFLGKFQGISGATPLWSAGSYATSMLQSGVVVGLLLGVVVFVVMRVLRSSTGVQLEAMGRNIGLAEGVGVGVRRRAVEVFVIASVCAALGGVITASFQGLATPDILAQPAELTLLVMFFLGGRRSVVSVVFVSVAFEYLSVSVKAVSVNLLIIDGIVLLLVLVAEPDGIGGLAAGLGEAVRRYFKQGSATRTSVSHDAVAMSHTLMDQAATTAEGAKQ